jgi:hypothetical protein
MAMWVCDIRYEVCTYAGKENIITVLLSMNPLFLGSYLRAKELEGKPY